MDALSQARELLPAEIGQALERETNCNAEEIRLRVGMPPTVLIAGREKRLLEAGAVFASMSGSGSTVFGLFEHNAESGSDARFRTLYEEFAPMILLDDTL